MEFTGQNSLHKKNWQTESWREKERVVLKAEVNLTHSFRQTKKRSHLSSLSLSISICLCGKMRTSIVRSVQSAIARSSSSSRSTYVCARAYSSDSVPERKVAVLGAAGGIGQPLALLMKLNPLVSKLSLYDIAGTPGVAADVSHINTRSEVSLSLSLSFLRFLFSTDLGFFSD